MTQFAAQLPPEVANVTMSFLTMEPKMQQSNSPGPFHYQRWGTDQCFDRMHTDTTAILPREIGWPPALTRQLQKVWTTTRWIEFDNHVHPETTVNHPVPQGCWR